MTEFSRKDAKVFISGLLVGVVILSIAYSLLKLFPVIAPLAFSYLWCVFNALRIRRRFIEFGLRIGAVASYTLLSFLWTIIYLASLDALVISGNSVFDFTRIILAPLGVQLPKDVSLSQASFIVSTISVVFFSTIAKVVRKYWEFVRIFAYPPEYPPDDVED